MEEKKYDLICVGGGIMSATLALLLKKLQPSLEILIIERLDKVAKESSAAWNNAGTGHSALCELNYTPKDENGNVNISKAIKICEQFETSKQFWSFLVKENLIEDPSSFITRVPHHSWVYGKENVDYLEKRYEVMKEHFMFNTIEFTKEIGQMKNWFPLIMQSRTEDEIMAASRIERGAEMNFGALTEQLFHILETKYDTKVYCENEVVHVDPNSQDWCVKVKNLKTDAIKHIGAKHVFIGAGGGSLLLIGNNRRAGEGRVRRFSYKWGMVGL